MNDYQRMPTHVLVVFLALGTLVSGCRPSARRARIIRIGAAAAGYYLPEFVIQDLHLLERHGCTCQLQVFNSASTMMDAFLNHNLDLTALSSGGLFPLESRYPGRFTFVYAQNNKSYAFMVRRASEIHAMPDLRGKRIATWSSPSTRVLVDLCLKPFFNPEDVSIRQVDVKLLNQLLLQKEVDAIFNSDVFIAEGVRTVGASVLDDYPLEKYVLRPFFSGGGFVDKAALADTPAAMPCIQQASDDAIDYIKTHNREARLLMKRHVAASEADLLMAPLDEYLHLRDVDITNAQKVADIFLERKLLEHKIDVTRMFQQ